MANSLLDSIFNNDDLWKPQQAPQENGSAPIQTGHGQIVDSVTNLLANIGEGALHALPDTVGFVGDLLNEGAKIRRGNFSDIHLPGTGKVAQSVDKSFDLAEDTYTHGQTPHPHNKAERYAHDVSEGVASTLIGGGPDAALPAIAAGTAGPVAGDLTFDLTGNEALASVAGLAGMVLGGFTPHIVNSIQNARTIGAGASHPDFGKLVRMVEDREGGGTLAHPAVNPKSGAMGPMQVTPETARAPGYGIRPWNGKDQADLARVGRQKLAALMGKYNGDTEKAFAAYNWGEGHVDAAIHKYGDNWLDHAPPETQHYVEGVEAPDGLPGNSSVRPINPSDIAGAMNDPEAALAEVAFHPQPGKMDLRNDLGEPLTMHNGSPDARALTDISAQGEELLQKLKNKEISLDEYDAQLAPLSAASKAIMKRMADQHAEYTRGMDAAVQDYDASVPKPNPPEAVDARTVGQGADYPERVPVNDTNVVSLDQVRDEKNLKAFHADLMSKVSDGAELRRQLGEEAHNSGLLPMEVGDRFSTAMSREKGQGPWKVVGHYVDPKDPERYGYYVSRGSGEDAERSLMLVSDPKADAERIRRGWGAYDRKADVAKWQKQTGPKSVETSELERDRNPPAQSSSFGTDRPNQRNRQEPTKSEAGHEDAGPMRPTRTDEELTSKLANTVKTAKPLREQQEHLYTAERAKRRQMMEDAAKLTSGEARAHARLSALKGELPKVSFEAIGDQFSQAEKDRLHDMIEESPKLDAWGKADGHVALKKVLNGELPTHGELRTLADAFPDEVIKSLLNKRDFGERFNDFLLNASSTARALRASGDLSAPLRQGINLIGTKAYWKSFFTMFKSMGKDNFEALQHEIATRSTYPLMKRAGLALTDTSRILSDREEMFMSTWAEKLPHVKYAERAYTAFLNKLRADTFDALVKQSYAAGIDFRENPRALKDIAEYVNNATGRGDLGSLAGSYKLLNATLFSPRLMMSRMKMLTWMMRPSFYMKLNPVVRRAYIKNMITMGGIITTVVGAAKMGGLGVETDPRSSDFGKVKIGNTRFDPWGGYQQYVHLATVLSTGESKSPVTGSVTKLNTGKFGSRTRVDAILDFMRNKESPMASDVDEILSGPVDRFGQKVNAKSLAIGLVAPMVEEDVRQAFQDNKTAGTVAIPAAVFGAGVQTFTPKPPKAGKGTSDPFKYDGVDDVFNDKSLWGPTQ